MKIGNNVVKGLPIILELDNIERTHVKWNVNSTDGLLLFVYFSNRQGSKGLEACYKYNNKNNPDAFWDFLNGCVRY